jgi:hypothetical protein
MITDPPAASAGGAIPGSSRVERPLVLRAVAALRSAVIAAVDTFDTLLSRLPNRDARTVGVAVAEIRGQAGTAFDPAVVEAFCRAIRLGEITITTTWAPAAAFAMAASFGR